MSEKNTPSTSTSDESDHDPSLTFVGFCKTQLQLIASPGSSKSFDDETTSNCGICNLYCLAKCLGSDRTVKTIDAHDEIQMLGIGTENIRPFIRKSLFSNMSPTICFYTRGNKVKKPHNRHLNGLTWCQNSLLPLVIRQSLLTSHFKVVAEDTQWIGYWGRHLKSAQYKSIQPHQKVNHFPGEFHVGRKDRLWQHIYNMMRSGNDAGNDDRWTIMPFTYILPRDSRKLRSYLSMSGSRRHVILKPPASARGTGISIVSNYSAVPLKTPLIAQHYIESPLTINGSKFDLRIYVYVSSLSPLKIYIYEEGLVRFASVAYEPSSYSNRFMHLTNYSINKAFINTKKSDSALLHAKSTSTTVKWKISEFWAYLQNQGHDADLLRSSIEGIAIKALIATESSIREHTSRNFDWPFACHELFGMDILIDSNLRPWLMEMNISPALLAPSQTDTDVKAPLAKDVLNMMGIPFPIHTYDSECDVHSHAFIKSLFYRTRNFNMHKSMEHLFKEEFHLSYFAQNNEIHESILETLTDADVRILVEFEDEQTRRGSFKCIFPLGTQTQDYLQFITLPVYSNLLLTQWQIFQSNNSSRQSGIDLLESYCIRGTHIAPFIADHVKLDGKKPSLDSTEIALVSTE